MLKIVAIALALAACQLTAPGQPTAAPHQQTWDAALGACRWAARCVPWIAVRPGDDLVYRCADGVQWDLIDSADASWSACEGALAASQACGDVAAPDACLPWWPDGRLSYPEEP